MITIVTHSPLAYSKEYWKEKVQRLRGVVRGPHALLLSLCRGLETQNVPFQVNPPLKEWSETVHVLSGIEALRIAIKAKQQGKIKKLIAGPTLVVTPHEYDSIITAPEIDIVLEPSKWVKDFYVHEAPILKDKIHTWAGGVQIPKIFSSRNTGHVLVYQKNAPKELFESIKNTLREKGISFTVLTYGSFKQTDFYTYLEKSDAMIYLSESESQGIALHEAWMRDVPTLVWNRGFWQYQSHQWQDPHISAPYLTKETGMFFSGINDFKNTLEVFIKNLPSYTPRAHSLVHHTDAVSARQYLDILNT